MKPNRCISLIICFISCFLVMNFLDEGFVSASHNAVLEEVYAGYDSDEDKSPNGIYLHKSRVEISGTIIEIESPLVTLATSSDKSISRPFIDGNLVTWSEKTGGIQQPYYFFIGENKIYTIPVSLLNGETIKSSNGVLLYRNAEKNPCIYNMSNETRFGLEAGSSSKIGDIRAEFVAISGDKIVFLAENCKTFYLVGDISDTVDPIFERQYRASNLHLSLYNGQVLMFWREGGKQYYCNLDSLGANNEFIINELANDFISLAYNLDTYGDRLVYFAREKDKTALYIQEMIGDGRPEKILETGDNAVFLYDNLLYYVEGKNIKICDLDNKEPSLLVECDSPPTWIVSNGRDLIWKDSHNIYWLAPISKLEILGVPVEVFKGDKFRLAGKAIYSNGFTEEEISAGTWTSSHPKVAVIEDNYIEAVSAGQAILTWSYKGAETDFTLSVKQMLDLEISYKYPLLDVGESMEMRVFLLYADGDKEDVTDAVTWKSSINEVINGIYYANNAGNDVISASYADLTTSFTK